MTSQRKIIYDFGANNGDDVAYYLKKADVVVAVEANPALCEEIEQRFPQAIAEGRLFVENCVLTAHGAEGKVDFYIHKRNHVLSQFPRPDEDAIDKYERVLLPARAVTSLLARYGDPYYIKIDIEHCEEAILKELFRVNIRPPFISAESHSIQVFALLVGLGEYSAFKLVDGASVAKKYGNCTIAVDGKTESYSFPRQSAGPFGEDVAGEWLSGDDFFLLLAKAKLGWKDIHATNLVAPAPAHHFKVDRYVRKIFRQNVLGRLKSLLSHR
jgi:FkbM family methyltransferase